MNTTSAPNRATFGMFKNTRNSTTTTTNSNNNSNKRMLSIMSATKATKQGGEEERKVVQSKDDLKKKKENEGKRKKKGVDVKSMPGDDDDDDDDDDDAEYEYEEVEVDEDGNEIVSASNDDEEELREEGETGAVDELKPNQQSKKQQRQQQRKGTVLMEVKKSAEKAYANEGVRNLGYVIAVFLAGTLGWSVYKVFRRATSRRAVRKKTVNKNVLVIERLKPFFPNERDSMTRNVAKGIARSTGFTTQEVFRKYLRYKMVEESFTGAFVEDILQLKNACELTPKQTSEILLESASRMVKKYGTLILDVTELTKAGAQRKMIAAQMFSKLCYLSDLPALVADKQIAEEITMKLKELFGATDEDYARLRVDSLSNDSDVNVLEKMSGFEKFKGDEDIFSFKVDED
jgi:hypothetical protein